MTNIVTISTHVLDTALGAPAANVAVTLGRVDEGGHATTLSQHVTDSDGRVTALAPRDAMVTPGAYRLSFDVAPYFAASERASFYTQVSVNFIVGEGAQHYHVPLLLSPFGYSTYRGS